MKRRILFILAILLPFSLYASDVESIYDIRLKTIEETLSILETVHPDMYNTYDKSSFERRAKEIKSKMHDQSDMEFAFSLSSLVAMVKDSHTAIKYGNLASQTEVIPIAIKRFEDKFHVMVLPESYKKFLGYEVIAIDDKSIEECIDLLSKVISFDNETWLFRQLSDMFTYSTILDAVGITDKTSESVQIELKGGIKISLDKISFSELKEIPISRIEMGDMGITNPQKNRRYFYLLDQDILYIQYNSCINDDSYTFENMVSEFQELDFAKIVIDLRNNTGGSDGVIYPLFEYLESSEIPVYCLIGENTFSSAIINATQLDALYDAILVGTPTGGSVNHFGSVKSIKLPNGLFLNVSTKYINLDAFLDKGTSYGIDSLYPDVFIEESLEDYKTGFDGAYNWVSYLS